MGPRIREDNGGGEGWGNLLVAKLHEMTSWGIDMPRGVEKKRDRANGPPLRNSEIYLVATRWL